MQIQDFINRSDRIVFFGGAGVSTESGIPDFRSQDGLYRMQYPYPPETILSHNFFFSNTEEFFTFYRDKIIDYHPLPNAAHLKLAELEKAGRLSAVITQNIDGLHQAAGSVNVLELHGSIHRNHCVRCGRPFDLDFMRECDKVPRCNCGGLVKPDVVLYGESLDDDTVNAAVHALRSADLLIIAGTSLVVYPAAGLVRYYRGKDILLLNLENVSDDPRTIFFRGKVGDLLSEVKV